jgi:hypothetical protein
MGGSWYGVFFSKQPATSGFEFTAEVYRLFFLSNSYMLFAVL